MSVTVEWLLDNHCKPASINSSKAFEVALHSKGHFFRDSVNDIDLVHELGIVNINF